MNIKTVLLFKETLWKSQQPTPQKSATIPSDNIISNPLTNITVLPTPQAQHQ